MTRPGTVAVVHLHRRGALGLQRRVETWVAIAAASGRRAVPVDVASLPGVAWTPQLRGVLTGELVPESLTWSHAALRSALTALDPELVVFVTARTYDVRCVPSGTRVVLDLVDVISDNYRLRCNRHASPLRRAGYHTLAGSMRRFEAAEHPGARRAAAGWSDAHQLQAAWIPNVHRTAPHAPQCREPSHDLLFHGTLRYEPNVEALLEFRPAWQEIRRRRPHTSLLIAGARPSRHLVSVISRVPGWSLMADFPSLPALMTRVRVAVAPLKSATGFQNKVLETAAHALPQVVSPAARRGLDPDFPVLTADSPEEWAEVTSMLLDEQSRAEELGRRARDHVATHYSAERFAPWL